MRAGEIDAGLPASRSTAATRGLARVESADGTLVAFATQPNHVAADGEGRNSPFARALLQHLPTPGLELRTLMTRVRAEVVKMTRGVQRPEVWDSLVGSLRSKQRAKLAPDAAYLPWQDGAPLQPRWQRRRAGIREIRADRRQIVGASNFLRAFAGACNHVAGCPEFRARFCAGTGDKAHVPRFTHGESPFSFLGRTGRKTRSKNFVRNR
jgi:hypothetical protein